MSQINDKASFIKLILSERDIITGYGVKRIGIFGSLVKNKMEEDSDVDLLVEFETGKKNYDNFINLSYYLENISGRKVELITPSSLSKFIGPHILNEAEYVSF